MRLKKVLTVRVSEDELEFLRKLASLGISPSTAIRFCLNFVMVVNKTKEFRKLVDKLPKEIKV